MSFHYGRWWTTGRKIVDPKEQFSKKLAWYTMWFWGFYMVYLEAMMAIVPEIAVANVIMAGFVTIVMFSSVFAYTGNSKYEKGLWATVQVAQINAKGLNLKNGLVKPVEPVSIPENDSAEEETETDEPEEDPEDDPEYDFEDDPEEDPEEGGVG